MQKMVMSFISVPEVLIDVVLILPAWLKQLNTANFI